MYPGDFEEGRVAFNDAFKVDVVSFFDIVWVESRPEFHGNYRRICN